MQQLIYHMNKHHIDIICIQETHIPETTTITMDGFVFYLCGASDPSDTHAGVGFVIAPWALPFTHSFLPHNPRFCSIKLRTQPKQIHLYSIYAPSKLSTQYHTVAEDIARKTKFWDALTLSLTTTSSVDILSLIGDTNARFPEIPEHYHEVVGPHVWTSNTNPDAPDVTNAQFLLPFLVEHNLCLPSTFRPSPPPNKITCKNIQATLHADWNHPNPHDFAALDYIILPRDRGTTLLSAKSQPTWVFDTHHFPVSFKIRVQDALPTPKSTSARKEANQTGQAIQTLAQERIGTTQTQHDRRAG